MADVKEIREKTGFTDPKELSDTQILDLYEIACMVCYHEKEEFKIDPFEYIILQYQFRNSNLYEYMKYAIGKDYAYAQEKMLGL